MEWNGVQRDCFFYSGLMLWMTIDTEATDWTTHLISSYLTPPETSPISRIIFTLFTQRIINTKSNPLTKTGIAEPLMYYGKVSLEFLTKVASHQKLGPPTPAELGPAQAGIGNFISSFQTGAWRKVTIGQAGELLARGVEIAGFFYVGEMIGRGSLIGYKVPG